MPFSFRQAATNLATSRITNAVSNAILGRRGGSGSSDYKYLNEASLLGPLGIKNLRYPLDVEAGPGVNGNQGHYIQFFINQQDRSTLEVGTRRGDPTGEVGKGLTKEYALANTPISKRKYSDYIEGTDRTKFETATDKGVKIEDNNLNRPQAGAGQSTVYVKRAATKRLNTAISMYMPTGVKATYSQNYAEASIGQASAFAADVYSDVMAGKGAAAGVVDFLKDEFPAAAREALILQGLKAAELIPGFQGATDVLGMATGEVVADRLELAFRNINKRKFNYTFKMVPRSEEEAEEIRAIIFAFKANMLPELDGGYEKGRRMIVPNTFDIKYMYQGDENQYLNKISTCVLENLSVKYGGGQFQAFKGNNEGAPMVETEISLQFKEMETITRERIFEGF